ncbi:uncharacterized protein PV09_08396 [Verruconis gallopava]|uniref:Arrestin C-terminal-like domain-containing protein n=1 Tax=Verruconis gallopava TaxID=253628 RepID=A0A0D2ALS2_9PEZI|nr:uncharacterized protein PV09_08396 [Verruconis gallopava]KIW00049.1 hypothetical protein PV09_08396 [Verruconis gallopava]
MPPPSHPYASQPPAGYTQVQSDHGRLLYLQPSVYRSLGLDQSYRPTPFQPRRIRPHRIHIARVAAESPNRSRLKRTKTVSFLAEKTVGKLAAPKESVQRFLKHIISHDSTQPASLPQPSEPDLTTTTSERGHERRTSWTPGVVPEPRVRRRPTSGLWAEAKRRSFLSRDPGDLSSEVNMRPSLRSSIAAPVGVATAVANPLARPSLSDTASGSGDSMSSITTAPSNSHAQPQPQTHFKLPQERPIASGNGVSVLIATAEPFLFLQGFDHGDLSSNRSTAMLRGSLILKVSKPAKIKAVTLRFRGRATTRWPEGIPPRKTEFEETNSLINHTWPFFNAQFPTAEAGTGADYVQLASIGPEVHGKSRPALDIYGRNSASNSNTNLSTKELKKLSLQVNQSRSFGKGESPTGGPTVAQKGYRTFQPGEYAYNFELPLDSYLPETIDVDLGFVKYELEAVVERAGAFKTNLIGTKEIVVIRTPAEGSLEQVEPIAISRNWEDQLHYDIVISGKSFPLGAQVPIAFKLTPLAKVQCHRIKVYVTESVEYWCHNKRVHRMEPARKVQLFEKRADGPPVSTFPGSSMRILAGGGVPYDYRAAAARGEDVPGTDATNLLGNLEGNSNVGPTEMEFSVQLPSCPNVGNKDKSTRLHFDTTYTNIQVHHWIKIVMRLSKPDVNDPTKRRHFEISIDSPFHILSCRATQANTSLPAYSSPQSADAQTQLFECGCPGAAPRRITPTSYVPTLGSLNMNSAASNPTMDPVSRTDPLGLARPPAAHIGGPVCNPALQRPMHIIRAPSFNPPAFEDEEPPPPLETPPPQYDTIASPTSGLADYFARLADAYDESPTDDEEDGQRTPTRSSRVEVPLTPGSARSNRSMDEVRTWPSLGPVSMTLPTAPRVLHTTNGRA